MRNLNIFIVILFSFCLVSSADELTTEHMLPEIEGWHLSESPRFYDKDNLYEYIDGNCELYFSYGFVKLLNAFYRNSVDSSQEISVDIYDMGKSLNAFGVYSSMIHPDYDFDQIGNEAVISSQEIRFWQNRYEVEIRSNFDENSVDILKKFARHISQKIPAGEAVPEFHWLIAENQIPHTLKYIATGFLGLDSIPGGFEARYEIKGMEIKGFIIDCQHRDQARHHLQHFLRMQNKFKDVKIQTFEDGFQSYHAYTGYVFVKRLDGWLYGTISESDAELGKYLAEKILDHLQVIPK